MHNEGPTEKRADVNGVELTYFEWAGEPNDGEPTILLAHATGFHARCWDQVISRLAAIEGNAPHVIALDQRGHGRSSRVKIANWQVMGEDLAAFADALDLRDAIGVGHSMGGHALVDAAAACPSRFARLVLIDPIINSPAYFSSIDSQPDEMHPAAKRKRYFDSPEAMFERFKDRPPFSSFDPAVLHDYCRFGLLQLSNGDRFELACPPEIEAGIYMAMGKNTGIYDSVRSLAIPVRILRPHNPARGPNRSSPTWHELVHEFKHAHEIRLEGHTHFLPMEAPELVAKLILQERDD